MARWIARGLGLAVLAGAFVWFLVESEPPPSEPESARVIEEADTPDPALIEVEDQENEAPKLEGAPQPVKADPPKPPPVDEGAVTVTGIVLQPGRAPAAKAQVALVVADEVFQEAKASAEGAFRFVVPSTVGVGRFFASLRIRHDQGALLHQFPFRKNPQWEGQKIGSEVDVGTLVLLRGYALDVEVDLAGAKQATVWVAPHAMWAHTTWWAQGQTDAQGHVRFDGVPEGGWRIVAYAASAGRGQAFVRLPPKEAGPVEIALAQRPPLRVTVKDKESGEPIAGASLEFGEFVQAPSGNYSSAYFPRVELPTTDTEGVATLTGLAKKTLTLGVRAEGYPLVSSWQGQRVSASQNIKVEQDDITFELARPRTIRWPIADGDVPAPADGSVVTLQPSPGMQRLGMDHAPKRGIVETGELVVSGWGPGGARATAVAPDGSLANIWAKDGEERGPSITFSAPRAVEAHITFPDGKPAVGFYVLITNQGNNTLGSAETDETGTARVEGLFGGRRALVEVKVGTDPRFGGIRIATVDLQKGDARVEGTVYHEIPVVVRMTFDSKPGIPVDMRLDKNFFGAAQGLRLTVNRASPTKPEIDHETGEIKFAWRPTGPVTEATAGAVAPGYTHASQTLPINGTEPLDFTLDMKRAGVLVVNVTSPADGEARVNLDRYDPETRKWLSQNTGQMAMGGYAQPNANGEVRLEPLAAGRYRAVDKMNGVVSNAVDVAQGAEARVSLDLSKAGYARGTVEVPEGENRAGILVLVDGGAVFDNRPWMGRPHNNHKGVWAFTNPKGEFWIRIPGNQPVTLRPNAPTLVPAVDGAVTLTKPREGVVLKMQHGPLATVRFTKALPGGRSGRTPFGQPGTRRILLYEGAIEGRPKARLEGRLSAASDALSFSGFAPGKYTVWIDAEPFAPIVLRDIEFTSGQTDLGEVTPDKGATLIVQMQIKPGEDPPRASLWATRQGEPTYTRQARVRGETTIRLSGLGPGTFRVRGSRTMDFGRQPLELTIESDGKTEMHKQWNLGK